MTIEAKKTVDNKVNVHQMGLAYIYAHSGYMRCLQRRYITPSITKVMTPQAVECIQYVSTYLSISMLIILIFLRHSLLIALLYIIYTRRIIRATLYYISYIYFCENVFARTSPFIYSCNTNE